MSAKYILLTIPFLMFSITATEVEDENLWLEQVNGKKALDWVINLNAKTDQSLMNDPLYQSLYKDALAALDNKDKLPRITQQGEWIYTFLKDDKHPRGVYLRTTIKSFKSGTPDWQTVIDIDKLSEDEQTKWVFKGMNCLKPKYESCLVNLSPGGGDAYEMREFNAKTLQFVKQGFKLNTAKNRVSWIDENHLYVGTDFGDDSMTDSGYPRIQKIWKRDTKLSEAITVIEVDKKAVSSSATHYTSSKGDIDLLSESPTFWTNKYYHYIDGKAVKLNLPITARIINAIEGELVISLKEDWSFKGKLYKAGTILLVAPKTLTGGKGEITILVKQTNSAIIENVTVTAKGIIVISLEDVKSRLAFYQKKNETWISTPIAMPEMGQITIETTDSVTGEFIVRYEDFLTAPRLYSVNTKLEATMAMTQAATFDGTNYKVEQFYTQSKDGTSIPYFVVMNKNTKFNGVNPTHIFSYGGFRNSLTPSYSGSYEDLNGAYGKLWLARGGIFVLANIRGGGEYGPAWHAEALLENRYKSFEDFEAVAEDLIKKKITSAKHLGIEGRSNGGLLVGATMTRRPDLYGAVVCGVPLLDMKRYHKLLAGASWMAEFGDPDTDDWQFIKEYSPYQNIKEGVSYPPTFFFTSTKDDRVHPGHARKMVARLMSHGNEVEYYENLEGGHHGSSTSEQLAKRLALAYTHLWKHLK